MLESDLDEINNNFLTSEIIPFDKPLINYNKLIDKLEISIQLENIKKLNEICVNVLTNMKENYVLNYIFYIFVEGKLEKQAIHRIKGTIKEGENLLIPKNKTIEIKNASKISDIFKFYITYEIISETNKFRGEAPLFTPSLIIKNEFEQEKFQEINFLKDISDYEPKLPDVKYSELTNQLTVTIPKKQLKQLENNLLKKKVKKLLNLKKL